jgi:hypothetical protein
MKQVENFPGQEPGLRLPVFDIDVRAQRESPYTQMAMNELGVQFWSMGLFNPQMTDQALLLLDMMEFKGKDELRQKIKAQGTMQDTLIKVAQIAMALAAKYDPAVAQQLAMVLQGVTMETGIALPAAGGGTAQGRIGQAPDDAMSAPHDANENQIVRRAAERTANASRPS